jgi:hypothetical protein
VPGGGTETRARAAEPTPPPVVVAVPAASAPAPGAAPQVVTIEPQARLPEPRVAAAEPAREAERPRRRDRERERDRPRRIEERPTRAEETLFDARPAEPDAAPASTVVEELVEPEPPPKPEPRPPPKPEPRPQPKPEPKPAPKPEPAGSLDAVASVSGIDVKGPLQDSEVRRGAGRVLSAFRTCYRVAAKSAGKTPEARVRLTFEIDESRSAKSIKAGGSSLPGLTSCVVEAARKIRTRIAPDVGTAQVTVLVEFEPTRP